MCSSFILSGSINLTLLKSGFCFGSVRALTSRNIVLFYRASSAQLTPSGICSPYPIPIRLLFWRLIVHRFSPSPLSILMLFKRLRQPANRQILNTDYQRLSPAAPNLCGFVAHLQR
jgi:hypothetical protein